MFIKNKKIYSFNRDTLNLYDLENYSLIQSINPLTNENLKQKPKAKSKVHSTFIPSIQQHYGHYEVISEDAFAVFTTSNVLTTSNYQLNVYNLEYECILELPIQNITEVSSFFITRTGYLAINDSNSEILYLFKD